VALPSKNIHFNLSSIKASGGSLKFKEGFDPEIPLDPPLYFMQLINASQKKMINFLPLS